MIKSKFISDILDLLLDGDNISIKVRPQLKYLTERDFEYTHMGLFVGFSQESGIKIYKANRNKLILNGVIIRSKEVPLGAEALLHFNNGFADYLEIVSNSSEYPNHLLKQYTLTQEWKGSPGRTIIVK